MRGHFDDRVNCEASKSGSPQVRVEDHSGRVNDPTYQRWVADVLAEQQDFDAPPPATTRPESWPPTRYEQKALRAGRQPLYWRLTRRLRSTSPAPK